jgi:hypothetical protein
MGVRYRPWKLRLICQRPTVGSRWYFGNYAVGLLVDSHPRFVNIVLCLWAVEIGLGLSREAVIE